jgi:hypothetical protein
MSCRGGRGARGEREKRKRAQHSTPLQLAYIPSVMGSSVLPQIADKKHTHTQRHFSMREDRSSGVMCWGPDMQLVGASPPTWKPTGDTHGRHLSPSPGLKCVHPLVTATSVLTRPPPGSERKGRSHHAKARAGTCVWGKTGVSEGWHHHDETTWERKSSHARGDELTNVQRGKHVIGFSGPGPR